MYRTFARDATAPATAVHERAHRDRYRVSASYRPSCDAWPKMRASCRLPRPWLALVVYMYASVVAAGSRSEPRAGGAKKGPRVPQRQDAQHKFMVNLPPRSQIMIYSEPMTGPGSTPICLIPGGEVLRVVTVRSTYTGYYVWKRTAYFFCQTHATVP